MPEINDTISDSLNLTEQMTMEVQGFVPVFGSEAGADRYFSERLDSQLWELANTDTRRKVLIQATRAINVLRFAGEKNVSTQPLEWPRNGEATIPETIMQATYEEALALLKGIDPDTEADNLNVTSRAFGKVRTDYEVRYAPRQQHIVAGIASAKAWQLLKQHLDPSTSLQLRRWS